jgi:hypothetical protein
LPPHAPPLPSLSGLLPQVPLGRRQLPVTLNVPILCVLVALIGVMMPILT